MNQQEKGKGKASVQNRMAGNRMTIGEAPLFGRKFQRQLQLQLNGVGCKGLTSKVGLGGEKLGREGDKHSMSKVHLDVERIAMEEMHSSKIHLNVKRIGMD